MTYKEFIDGILNTRGRFGCDKNIYYEKHHIGPKCMGGTDEENNLIALYSKEHFIAHRLLGLENPNNYGLIYAWWGLAQRRGNSMQDRYEPTKEEYEEVRELCSRISSERVMGENHPMYGKHHTEESKKLMSKAHKGQFLGENNPMYGRRMTEEQKKEISERDKKWHSTHPHPMARKVISVDGIFDSIKDCAKFYGRDPSTMRRALIGKYNFPKYLRDKNIRFLEE